MTFRLASRLFTALALALLAQAAPAQAPKDPPKDPPKDKDASPDELKAKEEFFKTGKIDEALKALQAVAKSRQWMSPRAVIAQWCLEGGNGPAARVQIEQAAAEDPSHPSVLLVNADFALREGRITDTILSCESALKAADNSRWDFDSKKRFQREARTGLAAAYELRGDFNSVKAYVGALLEADPKNAQLRQRLARANFLLNLPDAAFADLQAAYKDDMTLDPPELGMALLWTQKQDFAKADEWFGKAVKAHSGSAKVQRAFAGYLLDRGKMDVAKDHLAAAQKLEPNARETKSLAGLFARYAKDYKTATAVFEELVRDYPNYPFATANLALVLAESGDKMGKERAVALAENHVKQNQRAAEAWAIYAYCLSKAGRAADAEKVARQALAVDNRTADAAYLVARILADRGAAEDAHKVLKPAIESKGGFVYRKEAEALFAELDKKVAPPKK